MNNRFSLFNRHALSALAAMTALTLISGCTVGPDFQKPKADAPTDWTTWRSGDAALHTLPGGNAVSDNQWWKRYNDPVLDALVTKALSASPDIRTATLRFASARAQQQITASQQTPTVNATGSVTRIQQSENSPSTRALKEALPNPDELIQLMAAPSNWYQGGLDFSWEIDLWDFGELKHLSTPRKRNQPRFPHVLCSGPAGVCNVITGPSQAIGAELTANPDVRKLSFTGSTEVGAQ